MAKAKNTNNFFSWYKLFKKYPQYKDKVLQCLITERNTGKTFGTFEYTAANGFTPQDKVLFLRNTDTELKKSKQDFNNRFKNKFLCRGDFIYKCEPKKITEDGEQKTIYTTGDLVGYMASINNYINYKSLEAKDITYIIYEEFNEDTLIGRNIYFKFINIIKTFERFNKLKYIFMLGNRDGFDSDYFINWGIVPSQDANKSVITEIRDDIGVIGVVYDLGHNEFTGLENNKTIGNRLANLDNRTANYIVGGYLKQHCIRVLNYKKLIPELIPKFYLAIGQDKYVLGNYQGSYAIVSPWNYSQTLNIPIYSFDILSGLMGSAAILDEAEHIELIEFIYKNERANNMYYDSYDTKNVIADLIFTHKKYIQKGK